MITKRTSVLSLGMALLWAGVAAADHRHTCNQLAGLAAEVQQHGRELMGEFRVTFCSTPQYGALQAGARQLVAHAGRVHALAHAGASSVSMRCAVDSLVQSHRHLVHLVRAADLSFGAGYPGQAWLHRQVPRRSPEVTRLMGCIDQLVCQMATAVGPGVPHHFGQTGHGSPAVFDGRDVGRGVTVTTGRMSFHYSGR